MKIILSAVIAAPAVSVAAQNWSVTPPNGNRKVNRVRSRHQPIGHQLLDL